MKTNLKKLTLSRETVRALQDTELLAIRGGRAAEAHLNPAAYRAPWNIQGGIADPINGPCGSSCTSNVGGGGGFHLRGGDFPTDG